MTDTPETPHYLVIAKDTIGDDLGEVRLELVCTAAAGARCRLRPPDDREEWNYDDPDLIDGECWAVEWVEEGGWETVATNHAELARIPVFVTYDEGVLVEPAVAHPTLPIATRKDS